MKLTKIVAISSLAALAITPVFAGAKSFKETVVVQEEAKPAWSASLSTGWDSSYMFRGVDVLRDQDNASDNGIQWTSVSFTYNLTDNDSITLSPWMGYGLSATASGLYKEFDLAVNYAHTIDALTLGLGYTFYDVWLAGGSEDFFNNEVNASIAYNLDLGFMKLTPSLTYFLNVGPDNGDNINENHSISQSGGSFLALRLDGSVQITDRVSINPYTAFNFNFSQNTEDNGDLYNGANNLEYGLAVPFKINNTITVSGYIAQSLAFNENENLIGNTRQFSTWGGAKVTFSF